MVVMSERLIIKSPVINARRAKVAGDIIGHKGGEKKTRKAAKEIGIPSEKKVAPATDKAQSCSLDEKTDDQPDDQRYNQWGENGAGALLAAFNETGLEYSK